MDVNEERPEVRDRSVLQSLAGRAHWRRRHRRTALAVAALICSGSMAYAYFVAHQPDGGLPLQNGGETAVLFCWMFFLIAVLGPGPCSLDALFGGRRGFGRHAGEPASQS
jgi:hypothetical protein